VKQLTILAAALAAMTLAAPAAAQTLECSGVAIRPFDSYRTQIGTQNGPDIALSQRLFNGNHNGVISMNNDKTSYLVIEPQGGFDAVLVSGTTEKEVCSTPGPKPKFYSTHTEGGRIVLDPSRPLSASIKACTYHGFRSARERLVSLFRVSTQCLSPPTAAIRPAPMMDAPLVPPKPKSDHNRILAPSTSGSTASSASAETSSRTASGAGRPTAGQLESGSPAVMSTGGATPP